MSIALAQWAGQTVAAAAVTDVWESVRGRFARLVGRGDARRTQVAEGWLEQTREQLAVAGAGVEQSQLVQADRWAGRFADLLDEDPGIEAGLRALVIEVGRWRDGWHRHVREHRHRARRENIPVTCTAA